MTVAHLRKQKPWPIVGGRKPERADTEWSTILDRAVKNPNVWYRLHPEFETSGAAASCAYDITKGRNKTVPPGRWEATSRMSEAGGGVLFIKYLGKK